MPQIGALTICHGCWGNTLSSGERWSGPPPSIGPPFQNAFRSDSPRRFAGTRNCPIAPISSASKGIIGSMIAAASKHSVHQAQATTGCEITRMIWVRPKGMTRIPKNGTIQGMVR